MRKAIVAPNYCLLCLAMFVGTIGVGCKSMPKAPWSKTAATPDTSAETLAHSAPPKPSDIAKQEQQIAAQASGGEAAPFVPGVSDIPSVAISSAPTTTPGAYPTTSTPSFIKTGAPANTPVTTPTNAVASTTPQVPNANLGSIKLPYDPNAVPPAALSEAEQAIAAAKEAEKNRYANVATSTTTLPPANNANAVPSVAPTPSTGSRYGDYLASVQTPETPPVVETPANPEIEVPAQVAAAVESLGQEASGSRYAQAAAAVVETPPAVAPSYTPVAQPPVAAVPTATTPTPTTVANTTPYRPGGTSSYPTTMSTPPGIEICNAS